MSSEGDTVMNPLHGARRRRLTRLAVESIEARLAPSSIAFVPAAPPPHAEIVVARYGDCSSPGLDRIAGHDQPPDPC
jgi:hypothetical protein